MVCERNAPQCSFALLAGLFVGFGIGIAATGRPLPRTYLILLCFFAIKLIFNARKCTVSYLECKIRGVPKKRGYVNWFLDGIVDLRDDVYVLLALLALAGLLLGYRCWYGKDGALVACVRRCLANPKK